MDARTWIELCGAVATVGGTALASLWSGSINAAKFEAVAGEKFEAMAKDIKRLDEVDDQQWKAINAQRRDLTETREDVARIEGRMNGKANGAAGGRT
jgi:hypothetical protein